MIKLYQRPNMPNHWIGIDTDTSEAWLIPAIFNGWKCKQPYDGPRSQLSEVPDTNHWVLGIYDKQAELIKMHSKNTNQGELQYTAVRQLLQCGHAYATLANYEKAFRLACENFDQAGTEQEEKRWQLTCEAINAVAELLFESEWLEARRKICKEIIAPQSVKS